MAFPHAPREVHGPPQPLTQSGLRLCISPSSSAFPIPAADQNPQPRCNDSPCTQCLISLKIKHFKREYVTFFSLTKNSPGTAAQPTLLKTTQWKQAIDKEVISTSPKVHAEAPLECDQPKYMHGEKK